MRWTCSWACLARSRSSWACSASSAKSLLMQSGGGLIMTGLPLMTGSRSSRTSCTTPMTSSTSARSRLTNAELILLQPAPPSVRCNLSLLSCFGGKRRADSSPAPSSVCCNFSLLSCFRKTTVTHEIGKRIKELNLRLEEISKKKSLFDLKPATPDEHQVDSQISRRTSPVVESDIVGSKIGEDTQVLVAALLSRQHEGSNVHWGGVCHCRHWGVGKTTVAQKIFDDQKIKDEFLVRIWLSVTQRSNEVALLREVISGAREDHGGAQSRSLLEPMVERVLRGKKFFLVLDDVWDGLLRNPLKSGAAGSRVLVTTRNEAVAMRMKAVHLHNVSLLSEEDGWMLLCKKVSLSGEERELKDSKDIGVKIVKNCGGLPLAIKTLGGVLCTKKKTEKAWESVLESTAWSVTGLPDGVKEALYLSYEELPSHLKQCFLYCSLFPEGHPISLPDIAHLWSAEGFVKAEGSKSSTEIGEEYYHELLMRNLLQPVPEAYDRRGCKMHDLLCSLARFLAREESIVIGKGQLGLGSSSSPMKPRRVSIIGKEIAAPPDVLSKRGSPVRTLLTFGNMRFVSDDLFDSPARLRVLDLSQSGIRDLPKSLDSLIHLTYLDLSGTLITTIPESIQNLRNLQFINVMNCGDLRCLPKSIVNLHNLCSLNLFGTAVDEMPVGIRKLRQLEVLWGFTLRSNDAEGRCSMEELGPLTRLRSLSVRRLERASGSSEARGAALANKAKLTFIQLDCTPQSLERIQSTEEEINRIEEVFKELQPPPCLEELKINGYFGRNFPSWMTVIACSPITSALSSLRWLALHKCTYCKQLPPLGLLPNLEQLWIKGAASVISIGPEFFGRDKDSFPKLEQFKLEEMPNWEEWQWESRAQGMPRLKSLYIGVCPKLKSLPEGLPCHATALTNLWIYHADSLRAVENFSSLEELEIGSSSSLERVSNHATLKRLLISGCPALQVVENLHALRFMRLIDFEMESLPYRVLVGLNAARLETLHIHCSMELLKKTRERDGSEWRKIRHFQHVEVYSWDGSARIIYNKTPFRFEAAFSDPSSSSCSSD